MKERQKAPTKHFVVKFCKSWSSSSSRMMSSIARAASAAAIRQAAERGIRISYLKDGVVVTSNPSLEDVK